MVSFLKVKIRGNTKGNTNKRTDLKAFFLLQFWRRYGGKQSLFRRYSGGFAVFFYATI